MSVALTGVYKEKTISEKKPVVRLHIHTLSFTLLIHHIHLYVSTYSQPASFFLLFPPFFSISRYLYVDPLHCNMTYLLLRLLKDDLKEYTYAARLAGLVYGVASGMNAILVSKPFGGKRWVCAEGRAYSARLCEGLPLIALAANSNLTSLLVC